MQGLSVVSPFALISMAQYGETNNTWPKAAHIHSVSLQALSTVADGNTVLLEV